MVILTAIIHKEEDMYVAECPDVGTVSQGKTIEEAIYNLKEATELYLEEFPLEEKEHPFLTTFEIYFRISCANSTIEIALPEAMLNTSFFIVLNLEPKPLYLSLSNKKPSIISHNVLRIKEVAERSEAIWVE